MEHLLCRRSRVLFLRFFWHWGLFAVRVLDLMLITRFPTTIEWDREIVWVLVSYSCIFGALIDYFCGVDRGDSERSSRTGMDMSFFKTDPSAGGAGPRVEVFVCAGMTPFWNARRN